MDIYIAMEESYKNGYVKGCEDTRKELESEMALTRKFIHDQGLEFALASELARRGHVSSRWIVRNNVCFCPVCKTCGSPQWKVCPVCETKMEV